MLDFSYLVLKEQSFIRSGNYGEKVTPVPIPNTEVKLLSADGSWGLSPCESRTLPGNKSPFWGYYFIKKELIFKKG
jgi:hypothetical protein